MAGMEGPGSRPIYSISAVARMVGVPVATLRTWEDRYTLVVPERNASAAAMEPAAITPITSNTAAPITRCVADKPRLRGGSGCE